MALLRLSPVLEGISGNLAAVNFAQTKQGPIARQASRRPQVKTERQLNSRASYQAIRQAYQELTTEQYQNWRFVAENVRWNNRLGLSRSPTPWQLFVKINRLRQSMDFPYLDQPPLMNTPAELGSFTTTFTVGGSYSFVFGSSLPSAQYRTFVYGSRSVSTKALTHYKNWVLVYAGLASGPGVQLRDTWIPILGELQVGETYACRAFWMDPTALPSSPVFGTGTAV